MTDSKLKRPFSFGPSSFGRTDNQSTSSATKRSFFDTSPRKIGEKSTEERFVLPPLPDEDDDLLSHYASPKPSWDPLPFDIFPRPDADRERAQSASFPCFHYFDLNKFERKEARQLSAMDIIPKEALKKSSEQHAQRTKRSKRTTAESAHVKGYYRRKNEGVEVVYSHLDSQNKMGLRTRKAAQASQNYGNDDYGINENYDRRRKSSTPPTPSPPPGPASASMSKGTPKKQGNRLQFLANLRRDFALGIKPSSRQFNGTTQSQSHSQQQSNQHKKELEKAAKRLEKEEKRKRRLEKREAKLRAMALAERRDPEFTLSQSTSSATPSAPASEVASQQNNPPRQPGRRGRKKRVVPEEEQKRNAAITSFMNGDDKGISLATALTADEVLGASDEDW